MARIRDLAAMLLGAVVAGVIAVLVANAFIMPRIVQHDEARRVPDVEGQPVEDARRACVDAGLQLVEEARGHSVELPPGHVVSQAPAAGTAVRPGRSVRVTVSLGREAVAVPDLVGSTLRQARLLIANAQLTVGNVCRLDGPPPGEIVRAMSPAAGSEAARGDSVDLLVTTGVENEPYLMPALIGQQQSAVRALVESRGFRIGRITNRPARGVFPGTVLEQNPPRGAWIRQGESVDLVVADTD